MKNIILIISAILFIQTTFSQPITASGLVKNENGDPISAVLVSEFKSKSAAATYTDTLGFFNLSVSKFSKINVSCKGYNDTLINFAGKKNILIILSKAKTFQQSDNATAHADNSLINKNLLQDAVSTQSGINNNYVYGGGLRNYTGSLLPDFTLKEETKGNRYLFNEWAHGSVINADNSLFNNSGYLYNYDKIEGGLLMTSDKQSAIEVDKAQIKSFTLYTDTDHLLVYNNVPSINRLHFVQVVSAGNKYKIYKLTKTKFVKANYHTNGIAISGNPYDEYIDENFYFVLNANNQMQKISLKKKSIKEVFTSDNERLQKFFSENPGDIINEEFLKSVGDYLNK